MSVWKIILTGLALSMDAAAVTVANCSAEPEMNKKTAFAMPVLFALFQGVMPLIGYYAGRTVSDYIAAYGGYITAAVFFALGIKVIVDIFRDKQKKENVKALSYGLIAVQAVATSIDAFIVGFTFATASVNIFIAVSIIAATTFVIVLLALIFGRALSKILGDYAEILGAAILIMLAIETLLETIL